MEFAPRSPESSKPDKTGESKISGKNKKKRLILPIQKGELEKEKKDRKTEFFTSKKREGKSSILPLPVEKPKVEPQDKSRPDTEPEPAQATEEKTPETEPVNRPEELILPEVPEYPASQAEDPEAEYKGELIIDHSEEVKSEKREEAQPAPDESHDESEAPMETVFVPDRERRRPAEAEVSGAHHDIPSSARAVEAAALSETDPPLVAPPLPFVLPLPTEYAMRTAAVAETAPAPPDTYGTSVRPVPAEQAEARNVKAAEKRGLRRGVTSGVVAAWLLGRRNKRAMEREATRALRERDEKIDRLTAESAEQRADVERHENILAKTRQELRDLMRRAWDNQVLKTERREEAKPARTRAETETVPSVEKAEKKADKPKETRAAKLSEAKPAPQPKPEDQPITEEMYRVPEGRRVETSAWHRIEVDEKTGHAVENPSVSYGEAYKKEKRQEKLASDAAKAQTAAQVGMTLLYGGTQPTPTPLAPQSAKPTAERRPAVTFAGVRRETAAAVRQVARNTTSPLTWTAALVIVVLLFVSGILR